MNDWSETYRGASAGDFFQVVKAKLGIPAMFTEFGADAYNAREMREDQAMQGDSDIKPTVKVPQGTPVRVFVSQDLDFTAVGAAPASTDGKAPP